MLSDFYRVSITEKIYWFFWGNFSQICRENCLDEFWPRLLILAIVIYLIAAVLHLKKKITFFYDRSDAIFTIFSPFIALLPGLVAWIFLYFFGIGEELITKIVLDTYFLSVIYLLTCSFKYARKANPNSILGFTISCIGRVVSIVSILALFFGTILAINDRRNRYRGDIGSIFALLALIAIFTGLWSGLIWVTLKLSRRDEWGSNKNWFTLLESGERKFKNEEYKTGKNDRQRTYNEEQSNTNINKYNYMSVLGLSEDFDEYDLKKAYRKEAMKWHPDLNKNDKKAEAQFKFINEAYEYLSEELKRRK